jgi:hypothetical protein
MALLHVLLAYDIDLQISSQAHGFMSLVVGFLLVQRIVTSLARYDQGRDYLDMMNKSCRQLVHLATFYSYADTTEKGKEWRHQIAYRMLLLLRASMAVVDYPSTGIALWEIPELGPGVLDDVKSSLPPLKWLNEGARSDFEWNLRIPVRMSYLLRQSIRDQETQLKTPMSMFSEADLYGCVNSFMDGYYGCVLFRNYDETCHIHYPPTFLIFFAYTLLFSIQKLLTAPVPFPLIQMTATFLFFFLFTIPFAFLSDENSFFIAASHCFVVFILTYGMMGMDMVAIQLDDPFGDDMNDFKYVPLVSFVMCDVLETQGNDELVCW